MYNTVVVISTAVLCDFCSDFYCCSVEGNLLLIPLQEVETQKYLGIIFDNKLQWGAQLNNVCTEDIILSIYAQLTPEVINV